MKKIILFILLLVFSTSVMADSAKLVHVIRFSDYESGSEEDWLLGKGFQFKLDAQRRNLIDLEVSDNGLVIEAKRKALGIMSNETVNIPEFSYIEIDWGINKYPDGASYEQGIRNEALMLMVFMGDERLPSGSIFIPDSPYFIGLFLCHGDDRINHPYSGSYFKKGGRYVCTDRPPSGEMVTSRFNLLKAYRSFFDKENDDDPAISGIALALDTKKAGKKGRASAFINEIRFYQ
ncbi:MAG: hypothetical protein MI892_05495 [Desulfobacterales bacterium]|nr:hypothetical protein [Desulfobacterales bacterium]